MLNGDTLPRDDASRSTTDSIVDDQHLGLSLLWQAYAYALDAGAEPWDFALEVDQLYETGLNANDLRWLVAKGLAQHGRETSAYGDHHRSFQKSNGYYFERGICVVLTPEGAKLASRIAGESAGCRIATRANAVNGKGVALPHDHLPTKYVNGTSAPPKPCWNARRRELTVAETLVKRFRVPAQNQELILSVFEEESWPEHIDDPLPVREGIAPQTRLHDAINRLNGRQINRLLRFYGNGTGSGVSWELRLAAR